jgi:hypothetical protein
MTRPYAAAAPKDVMAVTGRTIDKWTEAKNESVMTLGRGCLPRRLQ